MRHVKDELKKVSDESDSQRKGSLDRIMPNYALQRENNGTLSFLISFGTFAIILRRSNFSKIIWNFRISYLDFF